MDALTCDGVREWTQLESPTAATRAMAQADQKLFRGLVGGRQEEAPDSTRAHVHETGAQRAHSRA